MCYKWNCCYKDISNSISKRRSSAWRYCTFSYPRNCGRRKGKARYYEWFILKNNVYFQLCLVRNSIYLIQECNLFMYDICIYRLKNYQKLRSFNWLLSYGTPKTEMVFPLQGPVAQQTILAIHQHRIHLHQTGEGMQLMLRLNVFPPVF